MGGPSASRSLDEGSAAVLAVYDMSQNVTEGFFYGREPRETA